MVVRPARAECDVDLRIVSGAGALLQLTAARRVLGWREPSAVSQQFEALAQVARCVRVVEALVPWGPARAADVVPATLAMAAGDR